MTPPGTKSLLITADDFGIGLETSRGILHLAERGVVTSTVLLANSPFAAESVQLWERYRRPVELGWHPCLTLDAPLLPPQDVPSLVDARGQFWPLGSFLKRLIRGQIRETEVLAELTAQFEYYVQLTQQLPVNINGHHHIHIFPVVARPLAYLVSEHRFTPFVRRVVEPWRTWVRVPGARVKRALLNRVGRWAARRQTEWGWPGTAWTVGVTDPPYVHDEQFFTRWIAHATGASVELTCHPGYLDVSLVGRDGTLSDGQLHRRQAEFDRLSDPQLLDRIKAAEWTLAMAQDLVQHTPARNDSLPAAA